MDALKDKIIESYNDTTNVKNMFQIAKEVGVSRQYVRKVISSLYPSKIQFSKAVRQRKQDIKTLKDHDRNVEKELIVDFKVIDDNKIKYNGENMLYRLYYKGLPSDKFYDKDNGLYCKFIKNGTCLKPRSIKRYLSLNVEGYKIVIYKISLDTIQYNAQEHYYNIVY